MDYNEEEGIVQELIGVKLEEACHNDRGFD